MNTTNEQQQIQGLNNAANDFIVRKLNRKGVDEILGILRDATLIHPPSKMTDEQDRISTIVHYSEQETLNQFFRTRIKVFETIEKLHEIKRTEVGGSGELADKYKKYLAELDSITNRALEWVGGIGFANLILRRLRTIEYEVREMGMIKEMATPAMLTSIFPIHYNKYGE